MSKIQKQCDQYNLLFSGLDDKTQSTTYCTGQIMSASCSRVRVVSLRRRNVAASNVLEFKVYVRSSNFFIFF